MALRRATPASPSKPLPSNQTAGGSGTGGGVIEVPANTSPADEKVTVPLVTIALLATLEPGPVRL